MSGKDQFELRSFHLHITQPIEHHDHDELPPDGLHAWSAFWPGSEASIHWEARMREVEQRNLNLTNWKQPYPLRLSRQR